MEIFSAFLRLGLTAFGGPAMVAYIGDMAVSRRGWLTEESFKEGVAVAQSVPGATAMQTAAYVGLRLRRAAGAAAAYVGFGLPAFILMTALSAIYRATHTSPVSASVFNGLQIIVVAIVAKAALTFGRSTIKSIPDAVVAAAASAYIIFHGNPALAILASAIVGILIYRKSPSASDRPSPVDPDAAGTTRQMLLILLIAAAGMVALFFAHHRLFDLAALMLRVDILAFGGGYASLPIMLHSVTQTQGWMGTGTFMDGIAMGQVTPGPIVITATFVGYQVAGLAGAIVGTLAIFLLSFVVMVLVVPHFDVVKGNRWFQAAMKGILASFVGLLIAVTVRFAGAVHWSPISLLICAAAFAALMRNISMPLVVVVGGLLGALLLR